ncbi:MAG TPA: hypothetical protein DEQ87_13225 [Algoriphagus sp.]|jgi:hypothetical protein|uniref:putative signal transducing protein n=1 Tax=unclassified Algoriphagus TaxID=2641541 RepID=UPI000C51334A|nr:MULTISPECIES: DUF2007 domain-containing protein [unclassified Algoriphagus]MAL14444.1 hypothetical protein [Algoriphagus sp.]MAN87254.1 hypothetical protein [Algoriphagus sp.]QYH40989.1 DUF2007 domain-containing protein [Algoriphagus sp. NBT04N3]HAH36135.1 hypothetical protein [Algoriphagus sp.]HAS57717.1 hypothetical protein [Algoriphagus sp.]|tara:strand:- start:554 stop:760 length:207 start_codon:yes stop_codon:yes gene_type:complete
MENWIKVFESPQQIRAEIVKGVLEENDIPAVVLSKKETAYQFLGVYEVHVSKENLMKATNFIQNEISF